MRSRRSYLIKPYYDWIVASDCTPYFSANATIDGVKVPEKFVQDGQITLNAKPEAIRDLLVDSQAVSFRATFGGVEEHIYLPLLSITAVYAKENQEGIAFDEQDDQAEGTSAEHPHLRLID